MSDQLRYDNPDIFTEEEFVADVLIKIRRSRENLVQQSLEHIESLEAQCNDAKVLLAARQKQLRAINEHIAKWGKV